MTLIRSERVAAVLLLLAAAAGLLVANTPVGPALLEFWTAHRTIPGTPLDLSIGHWVSDGLLAVFFFVAAVELKNELVVGQLNTRAKAIRPAIAALGGVIVPALVYLAIAAPAGFAGGWPIPTATDIAFALGILAVFGRNIPSRLRIFMLALAILDDIVAIVIIAVFFTADPNLGMLIGAVLCIAAFGALSRLLGTKARPAIIAAMVVLAGATWVLVYLSGVHATIAGVALGLAMARLPGMRTRHTLEPFTNGVALPLFAFSAALVPIPSVSIGELSAPFWGIFVALPVGKMLGIAGGIWLGSILLKDGARPHFSGSAILAAGALGGIGFTVSLLMNELAFADAPEISHEGTLAVLLGSLLSAVVASILVSRLDAYYRRLRALRLAAVDNQERG